MKEKRDAHKSYLYEICIVVFFLLKYTKILKCNSIRQGCQVNFFKKLVVQKIFYRIENLLATIGFFGLLLSTFAYLSYFFQFFDNFFKRILLSILFCQKFIDVNLLSKNKNKNNFFF